jgi:hypothetical protein
MEQDIVVPIAGMLMIVVLAVGVPLVRALGRRWEREAGSPRMPADVSVRLERMEQALDAVAVEIERISEGQRFLTKLMGDRVPERLPASSTDRTT